MSDLNIINGIMSVKEVYEVAGRYHATITEYLNSVLLNALLQKQNNEFHLKLRPVKLAMPVNLRRFFPSKTLRNFISMIYPSIDPRLGVYTFEEIITHVHHYMRFFINEKFLRGDITTNAATQRNPLIRVVPLFVKDFHFALKNPSIWQANWPEYYQYKKSRYPPARSSPVIFLHRKGR